MGPDGKPQTARQARALMRGAGQAALSTALARDGSGRPYVSLVLSCVDHDASPILLLSDLADHAQNLKRDSRAALLFEDPQIRHGAADPLTRARVSVLGKVTELSQGDERERLKDRFLAHHPGAKTYAGFADFRLYRMAVDGAHLVAGFGRIHWITAPDVLFSAPAADALAMAETGLRERIDRDHGAALRRLARDRGGGADGPWALVGVDPEGLDLQAGADCIRVAFGAPVTDPEAVVSELIRMANSGQSTSPLG